MLIKFPKSNWYQKLEWFLIIILILITSGSMNGSFYGFSNDVDYNGIDAMEMARRVSAEGDVSNPYRQLIVLPTYIIFTIYILLNWKKLARFCVPTWPMITLISMVVLSTFWSLEPAVTLRRAASISVGTMLAYYFLIRFKNDEILKIVAQAFLLICTVTLLYPAFDFHNGFHHDSHNMAWRGDFIHKNHMGNFMTFSSGLGFVILQNAKTRKLGIGLFALSVALVVLSQSRTAMINTVVTLSVFGLVVLVRRVGFLYVFAGTALVTAMLLVFFYVNNPLTLLDSLGRDATFSGRTIIWEQLLKVMKEEPLRWYFGYGYESFWTSARGASGMSWQMGNFVPPHAHNGYMQMMSHLGVCGLVLIVMIVLHAIFCSFIVSVREKNLINVFGFIYVFSYAILNLTESNFLMRDHFQWLLFVYCYVNSVISMRRFSRTAMKSRAKKRHFGARRGFQIINLMKINKSGTSVRR